MAWLVNDLRPTAQGVMECAGGDRGRMGQGRGARTSHMARPGVEGGSAVTSARTKAWPLPAHHAAEVMSLGLGDGYQQEPLELIVMFSVLQPS